MTCGVPAIRFQGLLERSHVVPGNKDPNETTINWGFWVIFGFLSNLQPWGMTFMYLKNVDFQVEWSEQSGFMNGLYVT